jgi:membrane-bound lytic murein transglycosylase MltF
MPLLAAVIVLAVAAACAGAGPASTASNATPAAPSILIPKAVQTPVYPPSHLRGLRTPAMGDFDEMDARGVVRVLVAESRTHYQDANGFRLGRTHDAAEVLQKTLNERPGAKKIAVIILATPEDKLISDLLDGKGDVAANILLTFVRDEQVTFAAPIRSGIRELVVTGPGEKPLVSLEDIGGRSIHVRGTSDHHASLLRLNEQLRKINRPPATIVEAPADATDEDLLEAVNGGQLPATIVDDYIFDAWKGRLANLSANRDVAVSQDGVIAWVTRKDSPRLAAILKEFFTTHALTF